MSRREENIYNNLVNQVEKISRHNRQGSFKTRERYFDATTRFCRFLAKEYGTQKFANISNKHLTRYIEEMQNKGLAASTIKTDLAAIRFFHDQCPRTKHILSPNSDFALEKRTFGGVSRAWNSQEYNSFLNLCSHYGRSDIACISILGREMGLRLHEAMKIDMNMARQGISKGYVNIRGKGGKVRDVPTTSNVCVALKEYIQEKEIPEGQKLFVAPEEKTHLKIKQVQNFINRHREKFQTEGREANCTFHGLRHAYAQEKYQDCIENGMSAYAARKEVSMLLGHERDEVTRIYLV